MGGGGSREAMSSKFGNLPPERGDQPHRPVSPPPPPSATLRAFDEAAARLRLDCDYHQRNAAVEQLWRISRDDATVHHHLVAWQHGRFRSFEEMLAALVVQLAGEKAEYMKTAIKAMQLSPSSPIVMPPGH